jgi:hypothetical protein
MQTGVGVANSSEACTIKLFTNVIVDVKIVS